MSQKKALQLLGLEELTGSLRIVTQGVVDGAAAFLSRLCLPAAEELGLALRDRISGWRARNAMRMLDRANKIYLSNEPVGTDRLSPRLANLAIEESSWIEDDSVQELWSGLLASATSIDGQSDENLLFMNLLKQMSSFEVSVLRFAVEKSSKKVIQGLAISEPFEGFLVKDLPSLLGVQDIHRIDRELDHLRELGLIGPNTGRGRGGGINLSSGTADLTPTPLALHLYVRSQGSKLSPVDYWNIPVLQDKATATVRTEKDFLEPEK
ncbi:MAG: hypothetical protein OXN89_02015 [Bryobacterales bacterium]|nr:hypothetical protein [Bryobacterales bacterium]